ncbi:MAG: NAD(P)H-dependent oxidoreductase [Verrucomicrobiota bacterium]
MKVLIVHAHHEPKSFCSALARQAEATFKAQGHTVDFADLYAERFNPVSDRRNFTSVKDPDYLKQQVEEAYATEVGGFAPDLEKEIKRLEACDMLIFSYPLWWFGMPAILKGWVDRVFASGRIYGGGKLYENGLGNSQKRALVLMTTGGGEVAYGGRGFNPPLETLMAPVNHGIFWFNGFLPLKPFVAWSPVRISPEERAKYLDALRDRLGGITSEPPLLLPPLSDFPDFEADSKKRFVVTVTRAKPADEEYKSLIPSEVESIKDLRRRGVVLDMQLTPQGVEPWHCFLHFRENNAAAVQKHLSTLPLAPWLVFEVREVS